jgi:HSP20 family protein
MERDRSKMGDPTKRTEGRGRWRDAAQREQENVEQRTGESMERDRMELERLERERTERERTERDRRERERMERESRSDVMGRGSYGGSSLAMREPLLASHFDFMRQFMREMSRMFEGWPFSSRAAMASPGYASGYGPSTGGQSSLAGWPPIEVEERDGRMVVRAELPGIDMQDVRVRLEGSYLVIEGERRDNRERKGEAFYESEWSYGRFSRRVPLPSGVTPDQIRATCENGVLELVIDVPSQNVREIPIRGARSERDEGFDERDRDRDRQARTQH